MVVRSALLKKLLVPLTAAQLMGPGAMKAELPRDWATREIDKAAQVSEATEDLQSTLTFRGPEWLAKSGADLNGGKPIEYQVRLPEGVAKDQACTGTCWIYSGLDVFVTKLLQENRVQADFEFSQPYLQYYSLLERMDWFFETVRKSAAGEKVSASNHVFEGGSFQLLLQLVDKWGIVPKSAMPGMYGARNSELMIHDLKLLAAAVEKRIRDARSPEIASAEADAGLRSAIRILNAHLGKPPTGKFEHDGKSYDAQSFRAEYLKDKPSDWAMVWTHSKRTPGVAYRSLIENDFKSTWLIVTPEELKPLIRKSIAREKSPVMLSMRLTREIDFGKGTVHPEMLDRDTLYGEPGLNELMRIPGDRANAHGFGGSHAMLGVGLSLPPKDQRGPARPFDWLLAKNSYGQESEAIDGHRHVSAESLGEHVNGIYVPRAALSKRQREALDNPTELVPDQYP